jgi:AcrR family transcriptional regulator
MRTRDVNKENLIQEKAIEMIAKQGLDSFSMQRLAKAANVSPATLYIYYKDRDDLITQLATSVSHRLMETSLKGMHPKMAFADGLELQWKNRMEFFLKYPLDVEFIEQIRYMPAYDSVKDNIRKNFGDVLGKFVHNAINRGELQPLPFEAYWSIAFAPLYQLIKFHAQGNSPANASFRITDEIVKQTLQLVIKALKP